MRLIRNTFSDAVCSECNGTIPVNEYVYWEKGTPGVMHERCYTVRYAPNTTVVSVLDAREQRIVKAHEENIKMMSDIVLMLGELVAIGKERNALIKEGRK